MLNAGRLTQADFHPDVIVTREQSNGQTAGHIGDADYDYPVLAADDPIFQQAFMSAPYATLVTDSNGNIVIANRRAARMFWNIREDHVDTLRGTHIADATLLEREDAVARLRNGFTQGFLTFPLRSYRNFDRPTETRFRAMLLRSKDPANYRILLTHDNLTSTANALTKLNTSSTQARQREDALSGELDTLAASLATMETFTQAASHDIKAPLGNLQQLLELFSNRFGSDMPDGAEKYVEVMTQAARSLSEVTHCLLDYASATSGLLSIQPVPLKHAIQEVHDSLAEDLAQAEAEFTTEGCDVILAAEPMLLRSLLTNLLSNAIKYRDPVRKLCIGVAVENGPERLTLSVTDTGLGFDPTAAERIFRPFERLPSQASGTGVGLSTCFEICRRHGWRISAQGTAGEGATFSVDLGPAMSEGAGDRVGLGLA